MWVWDKVRSFFNFLSQIENAYMKLKISVMFHESLCFIKHDIHYIRSYDSTNKTLGPLMRISLSTRYTHKFLRFFLRDDLTE